MQKTVINSTEGGAHIKGTIRMSLKQAIKKYCQESIDKSKLQPLLKLADDGNELISKVIPLLQNDIDTLDSIIKNSRKGMAVNTGIANIMRLSKKGKFRITKKQEKLFVQLVKEASTEAGGNFVIANHIFYEKLLKTISAKGELRTLIKMSFKNFIFSEAAHIASAHNPLVNVAIYGASRQIQGRRLKVDETLQTFLKDEKIALIRMERNNLILSTAKKASESLIKSYRETLELLKKYDETKDDKLLRPTEPEEINLDDAEDYFAAGNWAHPLLDAKKLMKKHNISMKSPDPPPDPAKRKIVNVYGDAILRRHLAIKQAKQYETENADRECKLIRYNDLIEQSKEAGKKEDFDKALDALERASELLPDETEARWGLATCLHHLGRFKEAIEKYEKLVADFPDNHKFQFELGQVLLLSGETQAGLKEIGKAMEKTHEFDSFLIRIGEIYFHMQMWDEAIVAYENYLEKFPYDFKAWISLGNCLSATNKGIEAMKAYTKALTINPEYRIK